MWISAQEKMKRILLSLNSKLVGNITFVDKSSNLVSLITVLAFILKGKKNNFLGMFPKYGVNSSDLEVGKIYGNLILSHLETNNLPMLQTELINKNAVNIRRNIMIM